MKEQPEANELTGETDLLEHHKLVSAYKRLAKSKKNELSDFLSHLTDVNVPFARNDVNSTLQSLLETRIVSNKEILPMTATQSIGFRLHPGELPPQYRLFNQTVRKKHKKHKKKQRSSTHDSHALGEGGSGPSDANLDPALMVERKKKEKKKEKKKDKKDKKDKKRKVEQ